MKKMVIVTEMPKRFNNFVLLGIVVLMLQQPQESLTATVKVEPLEALVLPNQNVTVMCKVAVPLQYCRVEIPGMKPLNLNTKLSNPDVVYAGNGLSAGQCGFTINRVTDQMNGQVKCTLGIETEAQESVGTMQLIVARAPKSPELDLSRGTDSLRVYKMHDVLQASCIVKDGRPVANISWYIDDEPLHGSDLSMPTVIDLAKENLQSKLQNVTRTLQASDNGKHLKCIAYHPAYPNGRSESKRQLDVKYGPLPQRELDKFGYTVGQPGVISVIVEANPKPIIEWDIGGERIKAGYNDHTGRITAEPAKDLGLGHYEANLRIAAINKHDTDQMYVLRAYNDLGTQDYSIKISTSPEPEGIELGIGGIIGIVIAILVLLLAVFLLIFAKITGRWCFNGHQNSLDTRTIGESSDTESADVRKENRPFSAIQLTSFFKKPKKNNIEDGQHQPGSDENNEATSEEEKKVPLTPPDGDNKEGLVYAELDLVSPNKVKPVVKNDDEKTEYAEIVYTPNNETEK